MSTNEIDGWSYNILTSSVDRIVAYCKQSEEGGGQISEDLYSHLLSEFAADLNRLAITEEQFNQFVKDYKADSEPCVVQTRELAIPILNPAFVERTRAFMAEMTKNAERLVAAAKNR